MDRCSASGTPSSAPLLYDEETPTDLSSQTMSECSMGWKLLHNTSYFVRGELRLDCRESHSRPAVSVQVGQPRTP